jgi:hypothetical protein
MVKESLIAKSFYHFFRSFNRSECKIGNFWENGNYFINIFQIVLLKVIY